MRCMVLRFPPEGVWRSVVPSEILQEKLLTSSTLRLLHS